MSKPVCLVTAPVATRSGYGAHSRDIVRALIELDRYDVKIYNVRWGNTPMNALDSNDDNDKMIIERLLPTPHLPNQPEIHIHIVIPNEFQPIAKYNIGIRVENCTPNMLEALEPWCDRIYVDLEDFVLYQEKEQSNSMIHETLTTNPNTEVVEDESIEQEKKEDEKL